jgi:hypothetical protein
MTTSPAVPETGAPPLPHPASSILVSRPIRPDVDPHTVSRFRDDRWDLSPAVFEENSQALSLNFLLIPEAHRQFAKTYAWLELNAEGSLTILRRSKTGGRNSVRTLMATMRHLRTFIAWLDAEHLATCSDVTAATLDRYLKSVRQSDLHEAHKSDLLQAVRRLWAYRELLPPRWRLPPEPCWGGKDTHTLLGRPVRNPVNLTRRIPEAAMTALLCWALRFVENFSDDIIAVMEEYRPYAGKIPGCNGRAPATRRIRKPGIGGLRIELAQLLEQLRSSGEDLPGRVAEGGSLDVDWWHLARLLDCNYLNLQDRGDVREISDRCHDPRAGQGGHHRVEQGSPFGGLKAPERARRGWGRRVRRVQPRAEPADDLDGDVERLDVRVAVLARRDDADRHLERRDLAAGDLPDQRRRPGGVRQAPAPDMGGFWLITPPGRPGWQSGSGAARFSGCRSWRRSRRGCGPGP